MQNVPPQLEPDDPGLTTPSGDLVRDMQALLVTFAEFEVFPSPDELPILIGPGWNKALDECVAAGYIAEHKHGGLMLTPSGETVASELAADHARTLGLKGVDDDKEGVEEVGQESGTETSGQAGSERAPAREGPKVGKDGGRNRAKGQRRHKARRSQ